MQRSSRPPAADISKIMASVAKPPSMDFAARTAKLPLSPSWMLPTMVNGASTDDRASVNKGPSEVVVLLPMMSSTSFYFLLHPFSEPI